MPTDRPRAPITPATRVAELLESWPELEEVLIAQAPAFRRLRNPVLRRTVARVATLAQAAGVGGIAVRDLVSTLRRAAGIEDVPSDIGGEAATDAEPAPAWLDTARVTVILDAEALLDAGDVPVAVASQKARALASGELLRVDSSFRPAPLLEALSKQGCRCYSRESLPGRFETFVSAPAAPQAAS